MEYLLVIGSYFIGSIPFGLVLGKVAGIDVRESGSGNIGATNVARLVGKKLGGLTLICDALKAILPMLIARRALSPGANLELWVALCGGAAFLGHLYPLYLRFRGGKGVATALGIFLYLAPVAAGLDLLIFAGVVYNWGYVSLGSLTAALMMPGLVWLLTGSISNSVLALGIGVLIWGKHRENIVRLMQHKEKSWRKEPPDQGAPDQR
ncbi:MAG: acyl-phosphate glycerol 3-phosphate acyltransferase [Deltaproteobacteria bacterium RIFOXYD12_FULL_55_16]|nr:MAG: acyl-phosphate glycerol 3-phosphate acyltransferase [Deltaproteobacteria bacterium RIFOXYD12_FULL_55_16]